MELVCDQRLCLVLGIGMGELPLSLFCAKSDND